MSRICESCLRTVLADTLCIWSKERDTTSKDEEKEEEEEEEEEEGGGGFLQPT